MVGLLHGFLETRLQSPLKGVESHASTCGRPVGDACSHSLAFGLQCLGCLVLGVHFRAAVRCFVWCSILNDIGGVFNFEHVRCRSVLNVHREGRL